MASIKARVERLIREARKLTWKPNVILLTGQPGAYELEIREWNGVPGSTKDGMHRKTYHFTDKTDAMTFVDGMASYWKDRFNFDSSNIHLLDISIMTDAELKEMTPRPLTLEVIAAREGKTLQEKLHEVYGENTDLDSLPVWADVLRWDQERITDT